MPGQKFTSMGRVPVATADVECGDAAVPDAGSSAGMQQHGKRRILDADVDATLARLYSVVGGSRERIGRAIGVLVFPSVGATGFWIGAQYGEGALRMGSATVGYYSAAAASIGPRVAERSEAIILLFMTQDTFDRCTRDGSWSLGNDVSVTVPVVDANGNIDPVAVAEPVEAFVLNSVGLMAGITAQGTTITRLDAL
ncbi:twin-arginine translocation pathway signal (plasmid) [Burkholderia sp. FERM BP-3421]|uniref:lipid-binding SYLF domain-containing protein n=1 Tax=Burkholderia sp. FERM BP-3421 TaxID=1494466 RepID=UPI0023622275|nr:YSC84-related protein [Burkholderia sp. FERM BP-3421]WDD90383.1 twin-arginine translocation pathway signal [Burkholderia sp. FERM BP-3421]